MRRLRAFWDEETPAEVNTVGTEIHEQIVDEWTGLIDAAGKRIMKPRRQVGFRLEPPHEC